MILFLIHLLFKINLTFAFDASEKWLPDNTPNLIFECSKDERFCIELCGEEIKCSFKEKICKNCIGTSILMTNIFEQMGLLYRNNGIEVSQYEFIDFINKKNFVSFTSRSVYNQTDSFDSPSMKSRFQSLCPGKIEYPVVFFELKDNSNVLKSVKFVTCGNEIYKMTASPEVIFNPLFLAAKFN
jgi:hypothetical protein